MKEWSTVGSTQCGPRTLVGHTQQRETRDIPQEPRAHREEEDAETAWKAAKITMTPAFNYL